MSDEALSRVPRRETPAVRLAAGWRLETTRSLAGRHNRLRALVDFNLSLPAGRSLLDVSESDVKSCLLVRAVEPPSTWPSVWSTATLRGALGHLRSFYRHAVESGAIPSMPFPRRPLPSDLVREVVVDEVVDAVDVGEHLTEVAAQLGLTESMATALYRRRTGRSVSEVRAAARERRRRQVVDGYRAGASVAQLTARLGVSEQWVVGVLSAEGFTSRPGRRGSGWGQRVEPCRQRDHRPSRTHA